MSKTNEDIRIEAMAYAFNRAYGVPYGLALRYQRYIFRRSRMIIEGKYGEVDRLDEECRNIVNEFCRLLAEGKNRVENHTVRFQREYYKKYNELTSYSKKYNELTGYSKKYMAERKKKGLCVRCGQPVDDPRFVRCSKCRRPVEDWSLLMKWVNDIGKTGEWLAKQIIKTLPNVVENYKLPNNKRIEFYWVDEGVGIDVTVTHSEYASHFYWSQLRKKVEKYANYLDELHVVVIEDKFNYEDYKMLNDRVPVNVWVYNFRDIAKYLPVDGSVMDRLECGYRYLADTDSSDVC